MSLHAVSQKVVELAENPEVKRNSFTVFGVLLFLSVFVAVLSYTHVQATVQPVSINNEEVKQSEAEFSFEQTPTFLINSDGLIKDIEKKTEKKEFSADNGTIKAELLNYDKTPIFSVAPEITSLGSRPSEFIVSVPPSQEIEPGRLTLRATLEADGKTQTIEQDFLWGVLALNLNQSTYQKGETVEFSMGVLDDEGTTLCDADLSLLVDGPGFHNKIFTTKDETITKSGKCVDKGVTDVADYAASFKVDSLGSYTATLIAKTSNGEREMKQAFEVVEKADFVIKRHNTATRIYPVADYTVRTTIVANKALRGSISEKIPYSFNISDSKLAIKRTGEESKPVENVRLNVVGGYKSNLPPKLSEEEIARREAENPDVDPTPGAPVPEKERQTSVHEQPPAFKYLQWEGLSLQPGDEVEISYVYDAPNVSPAFWLLGPIELFVPTIDDSIGSTGAVGKNVIFTEPRAWQLAGDSVTNNGLFNYGRDANTGMNYGATYSAPSTSNTEYTDTDTSASAIVHWRSAFAPTREEKMMAHQKADNRFDVLTCTTDCNASGDYSLRATLTNMSTTSTIRSFDVAYEQLSGKAMFVHAKQSTADTVYYCQWDGSALTPSTECSGGTLNPGAGNDIALGSIGQPNWIRLVSYGDRLSSKRSNEILLAVGGASGFTVARWDGDSWENITTISSGTALAATATQAFDIGWENSSGYGLVAFDLGAADGTSSYRRYTPGVGWDAGNTTGPDTGSDTNNWIEMSSDPSSDRLSMIIGDSGDDAHVYIWKTDNSTAGFTEHSTTPLDASIEGNGSKNVSTTWSRFTSRALFAYTDSAAFTSDVACWTSSGGFTAVTADVGGSNSDDVDTRVLVGSPNNDDAVMLKADIDEDFVANRWDGTGCGSGTFTEFPGSTSTITADLPAKTDNTAGIEFTFTYDPYSPWSRNWRWSTNQGDDDPSTWLANEITTPTGVAAGDVLRLRFSVAERGGEAQINARKKLQYTRGCDPNASETACTWTDVGDTGETTVPWRYATSGESCSACSDGGTSSTSRLTGTDQTTPSAVVYVSDKDAAADADFDHEVLKVWEIDYPLVAQDPLEGTYYFRMYDVDQVVPVFREQDASDCGASSNAQCTYASITMGNGSFTQTNAKIESDDGGSGYGGTNITTPYTIKIGERVHVRLQVENSNNGATHVFRLEYDKDAGGSWSKVLVGNELRPAVSVSGRDGEHPPPTKKAGNCTSGYIFVSGEFYEARSYTDAHLVGYKDCTEYVFSIDTSNAVASVAYRMRLYDVTAAATIAYTNYASFTANSAKTDLFSKARQNVLPTARTDLRHMQDSKGYTNIATDDTLKNTQNNVLRDTTVDITFSPQQDTTDNNFGRTAVDAGDFNGDGYTDILLACANCDNSNSDSGKAYMYYGGHTTATTPDLTFSTPQDTASNFFGYSVSTAGDFNGDGYDDIIVGCHQCDNTNSNSGKAYIYFGGSSPDTTNDVELKAPQDTASNIFGFDVASAGDLNEDGYDDVIVGCEECDDANAGSGKAYIFVGAASPTTPDSTADTTITIPAAETTAGDHFGGSVGGIGDFNKDGDLDVIVGCKHCDNGATTSTGKAYIYYGNGTAALDTTEDVELRSPDNVASDEFGNDLSALGDFNADGYADVLIGCLLCNNTNSDNGNSFIFIGAASPTTPDSGADLTLAPSDTGASARFGNANAYADINRDGYSDAIVGCYQCAAGGGGGGGGGVATVYYGGSSLDSTADITLSNPQGSAENGFSNGVGAAEINGDGFIEVLVGCVFCDGATANNAGKAFVFHSGNVMDTTSDKTINDPNANDSDSFGRHFASGDFNGDGYNDMLVGCAGGNAASCDEVGLGLSNIGKAYIFYGGVTPDTTVDVELLNPDRQSSGVFGYAVASGDFNGDGYDDALVSCSECTNGGTKQGRAFIFYGSSSMANPDAVADIVLTDPDTTTWDTFGYHVAAGDVNGDGYADAVVSCSNDLSGRGCDNGATADVGKVFIFYGASSMTTPDSTADVTLVSPDNTATDLFGIRVVSEDINNDGFDDVVAGCAFCDNGGTSRGKVFIFHGGSSMDTTADITLTDPDNVDGDFFGYDVTSGDVNGDGYFDVIVGCPQCDNGGTSTDNKGEVYIFFGAASMTTPDSTADVNLTDPDNTNSDTFGRVKALAKDINGDGYDDVIVGCSACDNGGTLGTGKAFIFYGGISMTTPDSGADITLLGPDNVTNDGFGIAALSSDINGDGYADVTVGCVGCDAGGTDRGKVFTFMGGKSADYNIFNFAHKHSDNTSQISVTWKGQSSLAAGTKNILLQVYRFGGTNAWETITTESSLAADTAGTVSGTRTTTLSEYYEASTNITYWRLYQQADSATLGNNLQSQYVAFTFGVAISGTVYMSNESTLGTTGNGGPCDGSTAVISIRVDAGSATTGSCHASAATYSIDVFAGTGNVITIYLTSTMKANSVLVSNGAASTNNHLYQNTVSLRHANAGPVIITDLDNYDSDQNNTDMLYDAEDNSPDTLVTEDGVELHIAASSTFTPGGTITTDPSGSASSDDGDLHIGSGATLSVAANAVSIGGDYNNEGTYTVTDDQVTTFSATASGHTLSGTLSGSSAFEKVIFNSNTGTSGAWTTTASMQLNTVTVDDLADILVVRNGTLTIGDSAGDHLDVRGGVKIANTANDVGTLQTYSSLTQGDTTDCNSDDICIDINANTSTPSCANCIVLVGATSGTGEGVFTVNKNVTVRLNPRGTATTSDTQITVESKGKLNVTGSIDLSETTSTATDSLALSETIICTSTALTNDAHDNKHVRMTDGLAVGMVYRITDTKATDSNCATDGHSSLTRADTTTSDVVVTSATTVGTVRNVCVPTIISANNEKIGWYLKDVTGSTGYLRIVDTSNDDASCTGTDDLIVVTSYPDSISIVAASDTVDITDGVRSGDKFEIYDYAHVTAENGTACNATPGPVTLGEAYIDANDGSETVIQYGDICNMAIVRFGDASGVNGANSSEGMTISKSRLTNSYWGLWLADVRNNIGTKGIRDTLFSGNTVGFSGTTPTSSLNIEVDRNRMYSNATSVNVYASGSSVTNNYIAGAYLSVTRDSYVGNNTIYGANSAIYATVGLTIKSNTIFGGTYGVNIAALDGIVLSGNTVDGTTTGLYLDSDEGLNGANGTVSINDTFGALMPNTEDIDFGTGASGGHSLSMYGTTLSSSTEVGTGVTDTGSYIFSRKHDATAGASKIWGEYTIPSDTAETPQDEDTTKFNYASNLWEKSITPHTYLGTGTEDTDIAYDVSSANFSGGPYSYRVVARVAGSGASCGGSQATFDVFRNGTDVGDLTSGTQFTDSNGSVNTKFTIVCGSTAYAIGDTYNFTAFDADGSASSAAKSTTVVQDGDKITVGSGKTLELKGQTTATNLSSITRGGSSTDGYHIDVAGTIDAQYYTLSYLGGTSGGNGLDLQSGATVTNLADGTYNNFQNVGGTDTYVKVHGSLIGSGTPAKTFANVTFTEASDNVPEYSVTETGGSPSTPNYWLFSSATCTGWSSCEASDSDAGDGGSDPDGFIHFTEAGGSPTFEQADFRFGSGTANNIDYTGAPAENATLTVTSTGQDFRLRMIIHVGTATLSQSGQAFKLQFGERTAADCTSGVSWGDVATGSGVVRYVNLGGLTDGDDISSVAGDPDHSSHTKRYQDYEESNNFTNSVASIASGEDGVWDFSLENNSSVGGKTYCFKAVKSDGSDINTYTNYPVVTIDEELSFALDASSKNFGTITPGASASDQTTTTTTTTNAASGYQVTLWQTQVLTNASSNTLANWTGTNATPTTLSGAGSSAFGYGTNDSNLGGGTANRFTSASDLFAGFTIGSATNFGDPVADNTAGPISAEQFTITYRLRSSATQEPGTYTTTIVLICTTTY